ncbi:transcription antitermination factor NusB [Caldicellulosiruptor changbaiensis]|uniref:Transcription antitermination protein NusB n=1 Tax=Caldicellulosiruptor changbaiensis TaxID=1222016 RepID=A0A3T0D511_9FIRM|nr:transcription antitermination factor NusB [Caldicellulosiruptor changbaiensis]AZT90146.1 transcription antitermination factor NusB [Caldicellulosiruptor changbaiensis]
MHKRRKTRELCMKILYAYRFQNNEYDIIEFLNKFKELNPDENFKEIDEEYLKRLLTGVIRNQQLIDNLIEKYSKDWPLNRIPMVELELMRIAIYELLFEEEIPISVAIDEAVDLSSIFGVEKAPSFVNGILGSIAANEVKRE